MDTNVRSKIGNYVKECEKRPWKSVTFSTKRTTPPWVFLYKIRLKKSLILTVGCVKLQSSSAIWIRVVLSIYLHVKSFDSYFHSFTFRISCFPFSNCHPDLKTDLDCYIYIPWFDYLCIHKFISRRFCEEITKIRLGKSGTSDKDTPSEIRPTIKGSSLKKAKESK